SGDLSRYSVYNTSNGNIQFPHKMKSISIKVNIADAGINTAGDIFLEKNGSIVSFAFKLNDFAQLNYDDVSVLPSDIFRVYFNKPSSVVLSSGVSSGISISAES
ncbi:MAG: hypothetical protein RSE50_14645, partial [Myroides sp.]